MVSPKFLTVLQELCRREIRFIVVGGVAAVLNGVPHVTLDIDLVHARDDANVERLLSFLRDADAIFRIQPSRRLPPNASHLKGNGHLNLITRHGNLDLLCVLEDGLDFEALLPHSIAVDVGEGVVVRAISLELLIELKERIGRDKDRAVLPLLRATLAESRKKSAD